MWVVVTANGGTGAVAPLPMGGARVHMLEMQHRVRGELMTDCYRLFVDRRSVAGLRLVECTACPWFVDYIVPARGRTSVGLKEDAYAQVSIHTRTHVPRLPARIVLGVKP